MPASSPDLADLIGEGDGHDIPTNVKISLVARAVGKTRTDVDALRADIEEIKTTLNTIALLAKILVAGVPVVGVIAGGIVWALNHLHLSP